MARTGHSPRLGSTGPALSCPRGPPRLPPHAAHRFRLLPPGRKPSSLRCGTPSSATLPSWRRPPNGGVAGGGWSSGRLRVSAAGAGGGRRICRESRDAFAGRGRCDDAEGEGEGTGSFSSFRLRDSVRRRSRRRTTTVSSAPTSIVSLAPRPRITPGLVRPSCVSVSARCGARPSDEGAKCPVGRSECAGLPGESAGGRPGQGKRRRPAHRMRARRGDQVREWGCRSICWSSAVHIM